MKNARLALLAALLLGTASAVSGPTQDELNNADMATDSWLMMNKGYGGNRYSPLDQINTGTAANLTRVCTFDTKEDGSFQSTPQVYKGVMFFVKGYKTFAVDASNCKPLWIHGYKTDDKSVLTTGRGLAIADGVLYRGTGNAHLIAIDAGTGKQLWDTKIADSNVGFFHSAAPIYYNGKVFIGDAGADWGIKAQMHAFDAKTGQKVWSFDLIPTGDQPGANTWKNADSTATGGGSTWTSYSLDPETGLIYFSVGNPAPDFAYEYRPGDNLYTDSVVALDAETGALSHYYQQIRNDSKDYDTASAPILYRTPDGQRRMTVATKAGYLFSYNEDSKTQAFKQAMITVMNQEKNPTKEGLKICPNYSAGSQWYGPAYMPGMNAVFVNAVDWCGTVKLGEVRLIKGQLFFGGAMQLDPQDKAIGSTIAYDATTGKELWRVKATGKRIVGGVTTTGGGLVMTGDMTGNFMVYDANTGQTLYQDNIEKAPIGGGASTYTVGGKQYIAVAAGNTSKGANGVSNVTSRVAIYALK